MPRILIHENDKTSPGVSSSYSNYAVLVAGFVGEGIAPTVEADSNNVYEFNSAQDFKDTIGLVAPRIEANSDDGSKTIYHYGNQMAYELLNMGYSVIYKPIENIQDLTDANFWEIFKDKASYDFRFITHGLLESSPEINSDAYELAKQNLDAVNTDIIELEKIFNDVKVQQEANPDFDEAVAREDAYKALLTGGYTGFKNITEGTVYASYTAAVDGTRTEKEKFETELSSIIAGGITTDMINQANANIANLAKYSMDEPGTGRGDCVALIEIDEKLYTSTNSGTKAENLVINAVNSMPEINPDNGKYCAVTVPSVYYKMSDIEEFENNKKFPGAFHYLACFINSLKLGFAEWYAAAGYTRGVSSYVIDHTTVKFGEIAINALEPRYLEDPESNYPKFACNVIANFRGSYYLWGNRTAHPLGRKGNLATGDLVASSFLNIRQLCTTIKKQLYVACRMFTFDPNSDTLWVNFTNAIRPTLEAMKADQGIRDYKILKVYTDQKATLKAKIRIIPIEAVEDFDIEVRLEDSFGETAVIV